jgi:hypothetical protein
MKFHGRRAAQIESDVLRVTVLEGGGHIAEILDKATGISPLWIPPWNTIEPTDYDSSRHPEYGGGRDASLLAGIMGHNLCLDIFGGPSDEEAAAGLPAHGETSIAIFSLDAQRDRLEMRAELPSAQLRVVRRIALAGCELHVHESVENLTAADRPVGWTEHVTIGPPFLENGATQLCVTADRSRVYEGTFGPADYLAPAAEFRWPHAPLATGGHADLGTYTNRVASSAYTAHRLDPAREEAAFMAFSPRYRLLLTYRWKRADFPWLGLWEENRSRTAAPWNGQALTCGLEFGVSPFPESRREMIERGPLMDTPTVRWIPARTRLQTAFTAVLQSADGIPGPPQC